MRSSANGGTSDHLVDGMDDRMLVMRFVFFDIEVNICSTPPPIAEGFNRQDTGAR